MLRFFGVEGFREDILDPMSGRFAVLVLAAGGSRRLGRAKQLVAFDGATLVERAARTALGSGAAEVIVVVGAEGDAVKGHLDGLAVQVVDNPDWAEGMGSSIRCGVGALGRNIECVVIALCDQPRISSGLLRDLAARHFETGAAIVASSYDGVMGAPCAFGSELFQSLLALKGESGARELIRSSAVPVETVAFSGGNLDVDTPEDLARLGG